MNIDEEWLIGRAVSCSFLNSIRSCKVLYGMARDSNEYAWSEPLVFDLVEWEPAADYRYFDLMNGCNGLKGVWKYDDLWQ